VDPRTEAVRYNDIQTSRWLGNTQTWRWLGGSDEVCSWPGGDCLVVTTGFLGGVRSLAVVRVGDHAPFVVDISGGGIAGWFASYGIKTTVAVQS